MVDKVESNVRLRALGPDDSLEALNREVVPTVRQIRDRLNEVITGYRWSPTDSVVDEDYEASFGELIKYDPSGGTFDITLPEGTDTNIGRSVWVKNTTTSVTAINVVSDALVDGLASVAVSGNKASQVFVWDGETWWRLGSFTSL